MTIEMVKVLIIFILFVAACLSGKFTIGTCAIFCATALWATNVLTFEETWAALTNTSVIMMCGMFIVAAGLEKTSLLSKLTLKVIPAGASDRRIMMGFAVMIILITSFVNGIATCTIMLPIVQSVCREQRRPISRFIQPVCILSIFWAGLIPLGGNAGSYLSMNAQIEALGGTGTVGYFTSMLTKLPIGIVLILFAVFVGVKIAPDNGLDDTVDQTMLDKAAKLQHGSLLTPGKEKLAVLVFIGTILAVVVGATTGLYSTALPAVIGALVMVASGIIPAKEFPTKIQLGLQMIFVDSMCLSTAFSKTGADLLVADFVRDLMGGANARLLCAFIFVCVAILTQFMSNTAASSCFRTIAMMLTIQFGYNGAYGYFAAQLGSNNCFLTPMASPSQAIAFGAGKYSMKQFFMTGLPYFLIYLIMFVFWVPIGLDLFCV